jgi:Uma2 family endonuclease
MATVARTLGPADHGAVLSLDEYESGDYEAGYKYELIDGRLYVSPEANLPEDWAENWLDRKLYAYALNHPKIINYVTRKARVFVPGRPGVTIPEPDIAAYHDFPTARRIRSLRWQDFSPLLVCEIPSQDDPHKDLIRNVSLYLAVPSIKEYWILDTRANPDEPQLIVRRRRGAQWRVVEVGFGETYTTPLLPGFKLLLDPRR